MNSRRIQLLFFFIFSTMLSVPGFISFANYPGIPFNKNPKLSGISLQTLQGDWKCVGDKCEKRCETCCDNLVYLQFTIKDDSISVFNYPGQYFGTYKINEYSDSSSIDERYITLNRLLDHAYMAPLPNRESRYGYSAVEFLNINFSAYHFNEKNLLEGNYFIYQRDSFDNKIVELLKKDSINKNLLTGKWQLKTKYEQYYLGDEQGDGFYHVTVPFNLPRELSFTEKTILPPAVKGKRLRISIKGKDCDFYITYLSPYRFTIVPGKWYKGKEKVAVDYIKKIE